VYQAAEMGGMVKMELIAAGFLDTLCLRRRFLNHAGSLKATT